jgi:hypothetical protein
MKSKAGTFQAAVMTLMMIAVSVFAQAPPNFSGHWTINRPSPADGQVSSGSNGPFGPAMTIVQDAKTLTMDYEQNGRPTKMTYNIDGPGTHYQMTGRGGEPFDQVTTAVWQSGRLVITITTQFGDLKRTLSMEGSILKVEALPPPALTRGAAPVTVTYARVK